MGDTSPFLRCVPRPPAALGAAVRPHREAVPRSSSGGNLALNRTRRLCADGRHCAAAEPWSMDHARRDFMIRPAPFIVAALGLAVPVVAWAQSPPPESDDARYSFNRIDDGYLRLDGRTGQVSICTRRSAGWACQAVADERTALEAEIARLQGENAALKKDLMARNLPLPGTVRPEPPAAKPEEPRLELPSDADLNKVMTFVEKVWRRLVDMIVTLQKDMKKT